MDLLSHETRSIVEAVARNSMARPDKLCLVDREGPHSYADLWTDVVSIARYLILHSPKGLGLTRGDRLAAECTQDERFIALDLACELTGIIFVPIERRASFQRMTEIVSETEASLVIALKAVELPHCVDVKSFYLSALSGKDPDLNLLWRAGSVGAWEESERTVSDERESAGSAGTGEDSSSSTKKLALEDLLFEMPKGREVAEILYTTGTTGKSKGIEITNRNNVAVAENVMYGCEMKRDNIEIVPLPLNHSHALRSCYATLMNGSSEVIVNGIAMQKVFFDQISRWNVTSLDLSPMAAGSLLRLGEKKIRELDGKLDYVQIGTAFLSEEIKMKLIECLPHARLYNFYGTSESGRTCVLEFSKFLNMQGCIGKPAKNARFIVTDEMREPIRSSKDHMGLLATFGDQNMKGYYKSPELTEQTMREGYIFSNDYGYIDGNGFVYVFGRKDDVINFKGIKIAPEEIEEAARRFPQVADCACVPMSDKLAGQVPKLFVVPKNRDDFDKDGFLKFLRTQIGTVALPSSVETIAEIPRTANGKTLRRVLVARSGE